jgi:hypothetical protein
VLGVCNGSAVVAATGLLDGRTATAHWSRLGALADQYPKVNWVAGQRFVQDGPVTGTAGVTSGVPGALRVMADLAGADEAERVGLNALIPWGRPTLGVALHDGVGEIDVASSFEVFDVSYAARPVPLSATGTVVSEHGMVLHTNTVTDTPTPTRLAIAGAGGSADLDPTLRAWADGHHVPVDAVHGLGAAPGFDGALEYLSSRAGRATAVSAAKMIDYPTTRLRLADTGGDVRIPALLVLGLALAALAAALPGRLRRTRPSRRREQLHPTGTVNGHGIPCHTPRSEP